PPAPCDARGSGGGPRVRHLRLPAAPGRVHAERRPGRARGWALRETAGDHRADPLLPRPDVRDARHARLRRRRQPVGRRARRARDQRAQLVPGRRGEHRPRRLPADAADRHAPRDDRRRDGARDHPAAVGRHRRPRVRAAVAALTRVCVAGGGTIGSLLAGHLARVADVSVLTRRDEHARALERDGLRVSGRADFTVPVQASADPAALEAELVIVACKGNDLEALARRLAGHFAGATVTTIQNGLGAEEVVGAHGRWPLLSAVTFMSGTRHSDTHVEYILDTATWIGPYRDTTVDDARAVADLVVASGLKAEAFDDLRPAQWSKLIFNATVNGVAALTGLPHDHHFAEDGLGDLVRALVDEGKAAAAAAGVE